MKDCLECKYAKETIPAQMHYIYCTYRKLEVDKEIVVKQNCFKQRNQEEDYDTL